ncbi:MAG: ABC transporter ATP-binding protein [Myxococcales bacterium]|nr:MAG: ABC transporter ATP-binding protein [Myxococcales bacterium]
MSDFVIQASGLRKVYRVGGQRFAAVDGLDLDVPRGGVHGFLGANGAGKTTTIRILLGLARPSSGQVHINGMSVAEQLPEVLEGVGAVVDEPTFTPTFTARKNLKLLARSAGIPRQRVDDVLEQVGLPRHGRKRFSSFSLGMKQRLAIAAALLKSPDLLILDEPTNGLDPAGIHDIRHLIQSLGASGVTVLLSSHILAEVQQVCDSVTIISEGKRVVHGRVEDLMGEDTARTRVGVSDPDRAADVLRGAGFEVSSDRNHLLVTGHEHPEDITRALAAADLFVSDLSAVRPNLETFFLQLTGHPLPGLEEELDEETTHELAHDRDEDEEADR